MRTKRKKNAPAATPVEAAKQLMQSAKLSRKINKDVFDNMFETPESIEAIKAKDAAGDYSNWEVVEEEGETPAKKQKTDSNGEPLDKPGVPEPDLDEDDEDDEDMDLDDMADDERIMLEARRRMGWLENEDNDDYFEEYDD